MHYLNLNDSRLLWNIDNRQLWSRFKENGQQIIAKVKVLEKIKV